MFWNREKTKDWACTKCGKRNHPDGEFCEFCGQSKNHAAIPVEKNLVVPKTSFPALKCPACGTDCTEGTLFCNTCGASLKKASSATIPVQEIVPEAPRQEVFVRCLHCGTMNPEHNRFCSHCSEEVRVAKEQLPAQNKPENMSTFFCPECGSRCTSDATFCNECGAHLAMSR